MTRMNTDIFVALGIALALCLLFGCGRWHPTVTWEHPTGTCRVFVDRVEVDGEAEPRPAPDELGISVESLELLVRDARETRLAELFLEIARQGLCGEGRVGPEPVPESLSLDTDPYSAEILESVRHPCGLREPLVTTPPARPTLEVISSGQVRVAFSELSREGAYFEEPFIRSATFESLLHDAERAPLTSGRWADVDFIAQPCVPYLLGWVSNGAGSEFRPVPIDSYGFSRVGISAELLRGIARTPRRNFRRG